jgi:hypothetical protein
MTAIQMNAELFRELSIIAEDETLSAKLMKYIKKLTATKKDPSLMTREEFFARVDAAAKGPSYAMLPNENLTDYLKRRGYDL